MRITVNLATKPFVELRPVLVRLRLMMAVLGAVAVVLWIWGSVLGGQLDKQNAKLDQLRNQTIGLQQLRLRTEARLRDQPEAAILDRAHFLNRLFLLKSFSWTAVMMDLEQVLPPGLQVTSIEPSVTADGTVTIRLRVAGDRDRAVQLVRNLEHSRRFLQPRMASETSQTKENANNGAGAIPARNAQGQAAAAAPAGVAFEILANYNPLPDGESFPKPKVVKEEAAAPAQPAATPAGPLPATVAPRTGTVSRPPRGPYPPNGVVLPPFRQGGPQR